MTELNHCNNIAILSELKSQLEKAIRKNGLWSSNENDKIKILTDLCKFNISNSIIDPTITKNINKTEFPDEFILWAINSNNRCKFTSIDDFNEILYTPYIDDNNNFICQFTVKPKVKVETYIEFTFDIKSKDSEIVIKEKRKD